MKFLKLEIKNLASLDREEGEVIDFEAGALKDSTIFSIVGPTGSGKSTILDAICLALYGRAPRYPRVKGQSQKIEIYGAPEEGEKHRLAPTDCRNILSRGKKVGYSKLTFLANNGDVYRAEWHVAFSIKNYVETRYTPPQLYKITSKNGQPEEELAEWDKLPEIIGLEYDQFLRTVLIAQGSFANFLKADADEQYELLEKLVDSEGRYKTIAEHIKARKKAAVDAYNILNADFAAYEKDIIRDKDWEPFIEELKRLEGEDKKTREELRNTTEALQWFTKEDEYLNNIEKYRKEKALAEEAMKEAKADIDQLALHDATLQATALYKEIKDARSNIENQGAELDRINKGIEKQSSDISQGEKDLTELTGAEAKAAKALEEQKPHIDAARKIKGELKSAIENVAEKEAAKARCESAYHKAKKAYGGKTEEVGNGLEEEVRLAKEQYEAESKKIEGLDADKLQEAKGEADRNQNDLKEAIRIGKEIGKKRKSLQENADLRQKKEERKKEIVDELAKLNIKTISDELQTLHDSYTLMTSEDWGLHRSRLKEGEACPLCGATAHPYKNEAVFAPVVNKLQSLIDEKSRMLDEQRKTQGELSKEQGDISGTIRLLDASDKSLNDDMAKLAAEWAAVHQKHREWPEDVVALEALWPAVETAAKEALKALKGYNATIENINKLKDMKESGEALVSALSALSEAKAKVEEKKTAIKEEVGDKDPDELEKELGKAKEDAAKAVNRKKDDISNLNSTLGGLKGQHTTISGNISAARQKLADSTESLTLWLRTYNDGHERQLTTEDIATLFSATDNWEQIRKRQSQLIEKVTAATTTYKNELESHDKHQSQKPSQTKDELMQRKTELEQKSNDDLLNATARLQRHETAKEKQGALFNQHQEAERLKNDWEKIDEAIGSDGKTLRKIAQCYTLRFLIEHSNAEIRKFNTRYELQQVKNSLGIRVIDHDRADDVRDITSLSGGETFIVSLGLALGLSALSSKNISFENLFIDEGFGSLDPDTLSTVINSLATLQSSQGKKVGVISHTETMSEGITTQIRIINNGHSGSSHIEIHP